MASSTPLRSRIEPRWAGISTRRTRWSSPCATSSVPSRTCTPMSFEQRQQREQPEHATDHQDPTTGVRAGVAERRGRGDGSGAGADATGCRACRRAWPRTPFDGCRPSRATGAGGWCRDAGDGRSRAGRAAAGRGGVAGRRARLARAATGRGAAGRSGRRSVTADGDLLVRSAPSAPTATWSDARAPARGSGRLRSMRSGRDQRAGPGPGSTIPSSAAAAAMIRVR